MLTNSAFKVEWVAGLRASNLGCFLNSLDHLLHSIFHLVFHLSFHQCMPVYNNEIIIIYAAYTGEMK